MAAHTAPIRTHPHPGTRPACGIRPAGTCLQRVVKVGGRAQADPGLAPALAAAWQAAPGALCVVHGGGDAISALQRALGLEPAFVGGRRVTTPEDIDLVRMALSGSANKRLVAALVAAGVSAVGLSGEDAALIAAAPVSENGVAVLGRVGVPRRVNVALVRHLLDGGYLPVISPLASDASAREMAAGEGGNALNVNGDDAAAAIAAALGAAELLLIADVPGVLVGGRVAASLGSGEARELITSGAAAGGMAAKLESALSALEAGVPRVRIADHRALADAERGTTVMLSRSLV